jgi:RNA polymerase sigma-70 factor (ECF subfamily)
MVAADEFLTEFEQQRSRLFSLAYRLLGSAQEAEDVVQDAYIRWSGVQRDAVAAPHAWLAKVVTNLALNRLTAARTQREQYVGPWLPEPVLTDSAAADPSDVAQLRDSVSYALLVLLERLTPAERAVFVLREAFGYSHREIAGIVGLSEANCRQLHRRARQRVEQPTARFRPDKRKLRDLVEMFLAAAREGDVQTLEKALTAEVIVWSDGGGRVSTARRPILGRDRVVRYLAGGALRFASGIALTVVEVNGEPALAGRAEGALVGLLVPEVTDGVICAVRIVANPDKLRYAARQLGLGVRGG